MGASILAASAACHPPAAVAVDALSVELATEDEDRIGVQLAWNWRRRWFEADDWYLGGYWEAGGSYWEDSAGRDSLVDLGVAAVARLQRHRAVGRFHPFVELGLGGHLMSETMFGDRDFDIHFAFGSHVGLGFRFGERGRWELGYRFQHLSNAGLGDDNPGIDFHLLRLGRRF